jgi:hypothetical protein
VLFRPRPEPAGVRSALLPALAASRLLAASHRQRLGGAAGQLPEALPRLFLVEERGHLRAASRGVGLLWWAGELAAQRRVHIYFQGYAKPACRAADCARLLQPQPCTAGPRRGGPQSPRG